MSIETVIKNKLGELFKPSHIEVINESHMHSVPVNSETHFKLVIVSALFEGVREVARHQQVYGALQAELAGPLHALAMHTYTQSEWLQREQLAPSSPDCMGGSKAG